jgi:hypothetical protein
MTRRVERERRTGLDGQGVGTDVRRLELEHRVERARPIVDRLARRAVDEIDVEVLEPRVAGQRDRSPYVVDVVGAAERAQDVGGHRLHAERQPVHPGVAIHRKEVGAHGVGIALHGDLGALGAWDRAEHGRHLPGGDE